MERAFKVLIVFLYVSRVVEFARIVIPNLAGSLGSRF